MVGSSANNPPFFSRPSYLDDADFYDDDPARYSPPFSDEEYADQMGYVRRHSIVDEFLDGFDGYEDEEEQQFALSMANTPVTETPSLGPTVSAMPTSRPALQPTQTFADLAALGTAMGSTSTDSTKGGLTRSRPIAIEMPASRRISSRDPPSAPLSARGDLPGGYFPEHEDPETRVHRPHPFHADTDEARRMSIARASGETSAHSGLSPNAVTEAPARRHCSAKDAELPSNVSSSTNPPAVYAAYSYAIDPSATTSIVSYNPTGAEDSMVPLGKYYPTNWENRKRAKKEKKEREAMLLQAQLDGSTSPGCSPLALGPTPPSDNTPVASTSPSDSTPVASMSPSDSTPVTSMSPSDSTPVASMPPSDTTLVASSAAAARIRPRPEFASGHTRAANLIAPRTRLAGLARPPMAYSMSDSESARRLQQYRRDMMMRARMGASQVLQPQIRQRGYDEVIDSLDNIPLLRKMKIRRMRLDLLTPVAKSSSGPTVPMVAVSPPAANAGKSATAMATDGYFGILANPQSPRLEPLGSPGPVTPIDLSHTEEAATKAGGLLAVARPRMPMSVATAPPVAPSRDQEHESGPSSPIADGH